MNYEEYRKNGFGDKLKIVSTGFLYFVNSIGFSIKDTSDTEKGLLNVYDRNGVCQTYYVSTGTIMVSKVDGSHNRETRRDQSFGQYLELLEKGVV